MVTIGNDYVSMGLFHQHIDNVRFFGLFPLFRPLLWSFLMLMIVILLTLSILQEDQKLDVDRFMVELLDDFVSQGHLQELVGLRDQLSDIAAEKPNLTTDREDVMNTFKPFEPVVEALRAKYALAEMTEEE